MAEDQPPARPWTARVLTLFPEIFPGPLGVSLSGQALSRGLWRLETLDIRAFAGDKHATVDDAPFGGGPGMVMRPDVVDAAIAAGLGLGLSPELPLVYLTPRGRPLDQAWVKHYAAGPGVVLLCGRYEGIDERVIAARRPIEVSLGDFVLAGGDVAAMVVIEACVRLLPGVIGEPAALEEESFEQGLLEYPQYTRPREWQGRGVPEVLLSGDHGRIARWRREEAERLTRERRPDLWDRYRAGEKEAGAGVVEGAGARPYVTASSKDDVR
jgi:tRNA (guanine37-N1)-methyltransferase